MDSFIKFYKITLFVNRQQKMVKVALIIKIFKLKIKAGIDDTDDFFEGKL